MTNMITVDTNTTAILASLLYVIFRSFLWAIAAFVFIVLPKLLKSHVNGTLKCNPKEEQVIKDFSKELEQKVKIRLQLHSKFK